jgi:hypothetical protein
MEDVLLQGTFLYFAYGSNMSTARLRDRTPSCRPIGIATLVGHTLCFHKRSKIDGSAKCDACQTGLAEDEVIGVVFEVACDQKRALDKAEGLGAGYSEKSVTLRYADGTEVVASTYFADKGAIDASLRPTQAYKQFVLDGAREHKLPAAYVEAMISKVQTLD